MMASQSHLSHSLASLFPNRHGEQAEAPTYDFAPFMDAPAVLETAQREGGLQVVNIPDTAIPSPLAANITPGAISKLKESLVGRGGRDSCAGGNGREVWASWKRAWDLWNNHYIEGRVNPVWVAEEWPRMKTEVEERDRIEREDREREEARKRMENNPSGIAFPGLGRQPLSHHHQRRPGQVKKGGPFSRLADPAPVVVGGDVNTEAGGERQPKGGLHSATPPQSSPKKPAESQPSPKKVRFANNNAAASVRTSPRNHVHSHAHAGGLTGPGKILYDSKPAKSSTTPNFFDPNITIVPSINLDAEQDVDTGTGIGLAHLHPNPSGRQSLPLGKRDELDDERSGGWIPIKNLPPYRMPVDPELADDDPVQLAWKNTVWHDIVENSVWRPRRVGEKTLKIDIDDTYPEEFHKNSELTVDGGVDCGREPYPVLRSLIEYTKTIDDVIKKKKVWDGVTGTIFNMPTKPLESDPEPEDPSRQRIKALYLNLSRDNKLSNAPIFPLDIRRVEKKPTTSEKPPWKTPLLENGESTVLDRTQPSNISSRAMKTDDPWWVREEQKLLRDNPSRLWPPGADKDGKYLATEDTIWQEEYAKDQNLQARYFVTNLHGGTLLVNGQQVRKGAIAGPLPRFAVIESPGGQVAFWWGVGGRDFGSPEKTQDSSRKWATMRMQKEWEHVALPTGEVWDQKIADRVRRERRGDSEEDDAEWNRWKNTKKAEHRQENIVGFVEYPLNEERRFTESEDPDAEIKWATARLVRKEAEVPAEVAMIEPDEDDFWPGQNPRVDTKQKPLTKSTILAEWVRIGPQVATKQERYVCQLKVKQKENEEARQRRQKEQIVAANKRKADEAFNSISKKIRVERDVKKGKISNDIQEARASNVRSKRQAYFEEQQMVQSALQGASASGTGIESNQPEAYLAGTKRKRDDQAEEAARQEANKRRATQDKPLLPTRAEWERNRLRSAGVPEPAENLQDAETTGPREAALIAEKGEEERKLASLQTTISQAAALLSKALGISASSPIPDLPIPDPTQEVIELEKRSINAEFESKPLTTREKRAIDEHERSGSRVPINYVRKRLEDLDEWRRIVDDISKQHIADIEERHAQGEPLSALDVAAGFEFSSVEAFRQHRQIEVLQSHYRDLGRTDRHDLVAADVPWRPLSHDIEDPLRQKAQSKHLVNKFWNMLVDLRYGDNVTEWSTQRLGTIKGYRNSDGTVPAVI